MSVQDLNTVGEENVFRAQIFHANTSIDRKLFINICEKTAINNASLKNKNDQDTIKSCFT